ncbi:glycoside hydrolase family 27 protein [Amycolatopsis minnesotensis]|uniref:Alpha-galactosidase n=1 Tax=Amycolatopsis minnesotensis TaxID=337894 RepID=A0ABN2SBI4_9PSEU
MAAALTWASPLPEPPLANGLARTPPMGWNSWNQTRCYDLTGQAVRDAADALVRTGMRDAGYRYVVVDDCWQDRTRGANGELRADPRRFPGGIAALADYVHRRGLLFGIYSVPGSATCAMAGDGYPAHGIGSLGHERQDAETFAAWGVDYLKYDWCNADTNDGLQRQPAFEKMRDELARTNRKIVYSISEYGVSSPWTWAKPVANLWRTTYDLAPDWASISSVIEQQAAVATHSGTPGGWNDPDMLQLGNGALTADEARAHVSLWAMLNAPLFAGTDLGALSTSDIQALTNPEVVALDQDFAGSQGTKVAGTASTDVWRKPLSGGGYAVALLNRGDTETRMPTRTPGQWRVRDLWAHQYVGGAEFAVPPHGVRVLTLRPCQDRP